MFCVCVLFFFRSAAAGVAAGAAIDHAGVAVALQLDGVDQLDLRDGVGPGQYQHHGVGPDPFQARRY